MTRAKSWPIADAPWPKRFAFRSFLVPARCYNIEHQLKGKYYMDAARVEKKVEADGELHLTDLPCRRGDRVEAIVLILEPSSRRTADADREKERVAAVDQFLSLARSSAFRSAGIYPTRDELHERH